MSTITFGSPYRSTTYSPTTSSPATSSAARTTRPDAPQVRLTGRGKIVVVSLAAIVIGLLAVLMGPSSTATDQAGAPQDTTSVRVLPGHTLWEIAAEANPDGDIRATVDEIIELNSLPNASALQMGSEIAVPVYDK
ncbi:MAG: LysM domain-containing protein [Aeromicrobium sp.]